MCECPLTGLLGRIGKGKDRMAHGPPAIVAGVGQIPSARNRLNGPESEVHEFMRSTNYTWKRAKGQRRHEIHWQGKALEGRLAAT